MEKLDFPSVSSKSLKRMNRARYKAREELKDQKVDWFKNKYYETADTLLAPVVDTLPRIDSRTLSPQEFRSKYEIPRIPIVLTHVMDEWPAMRKWTLKKLSKKYKNQSFKVGEDNRGNSVKLKMKYFREYVACNKDDSPLYIFDGNYGDHRKKRQLLNDYTVPSYFDEDLFHYVGERRRPPYRWVVFGPKRSGTSVHIDPLGTHAWNALISGYKRWILFPTDTPRWLLKQKLPDSEAMTWFKYIHPQTSDVNWPLEFRPIECLQGPGEMMFVPGGWWHAVLNVSDSIAVTQNYVSSANFPSSWHKTVRGRPKLSKKWLSELRIHRPDLAAIADDVDITKPLAEQSDSSSNDSSSSSSSSCSSCSDSGEDRRRKRSRRRRGSNKSGVNTTVKRSASPLVSETRKPTFPPPPREQGIVKSSCQSSARDEASRKSCSSSGDLENRKKSYRSRRERNDSYYRNHSPNRIQPREEIRSKRRDEENLKSHGSGHEERAMRNGKTSRHGSVHSYRRSSSPDPHPRGDNMSLAPPS